MDLKDPLPRKIDHTIFQRFLDKRTGDKVTLQPFPSQLIEECAAYGYNWLYMWALGCILTNNYVVTSMTERRNYFGVPGESHYRNQREGIREGLKFIAKDSPKNVAEINAIYKSQAGTDAVKVYQELLAFEAEKALPPTLPPPKIEDPVKNPEPKPPKEPSAPSSWKKKLLVFLGAISVPLFFAKMFLPGAVSEVIDVVIKLLKLIAGG